MKDQSFIDNIVRKGQEAKDMVAAQFSEISTAQFNWKPSARSWSIAECLEHLVISDRSYLADLKEIAEGKYKMNFWERHSPFAAFFGRTLKDQ